MKFKAFAFTLVATTCLACYAQESPRNISIQTGLAYNQSDTEWNNTTGIGIYFEANYQPTADLRFSFRFEPTALAYGVAVFPGGCTEEHRRYPGFTSCREGANYLLNSYAKAQLLLGQPRFNKKDRLIQGYIGAHVTMLSHQRYIITSREPGNWRDTRKNVTNFGVGPNIGYILGRWDLSASYNFVGTEFRDYLGLNLGYTVWYNKKSK